jgi:hypothetical protein
MDAIVQITLRDSDGAPIGGTVRIYTDSALVQTLVVPAEGVTSALLTGGDTYYVATDCGVGHTFETVSILAEDGAGFTLWGAPRTVVAPNGMCVVQGRLVDPTGTPTRRLRMGVSLISGDVSSGSDVILNDAARVACRDDGVFTATLYRGREYRVTFTGRDEYAAFDSYQVTVPERAYARLPDLLFPVPISVQHAAITGAGDYPLVVEMSDGRMLTRYVDVAPVVRAVSTGDVTTQIYAVDGAATLQLVGEMTDWSVQIYGRALQFRRTPDTWDISRSESERVISTVTG